MTRRAFLFFFLTPRIEDTSAEEISVRRSSGRYFVWWQEDRKINIMEAPGINSAVQLVKNYFRMKEV